MKHAYRLSVRSLLFSPAFCIYSSIAFCFHGVDSESHLVSISPDISVDHLITKNKLFAISAPPVPSSSLGPVSVHWHGLDTKQNRAGALIATNSPLSSELLIQLSLFGLDAELVTRVLRDQQFTHFYKFTPFTETGSAPLPILPEQLDTQTSLLGMPETSRVLSSKALTDCQPLSYEQPGIRLDVEDHHYHFSIKGVLSCGLGSSTLKSKSQAGSGETGKGENKAGGKEKDSPKRKPLPAGSGDAGDGADDGGEDNKEKLTKRESDEQKPSPTLQDQLVAIHDHHGAVETAAVQLGNTIGSIPLPLISWAEQSSISIDTTSEDAQQWIPLLEGISTDALASGLISNFPDEHDDNFYQAINESWKKYINPE